MLDLQPDHFIFFSFPVWSHFKSLVPMAVRFIQAQQKPTAITFFTVKPMYARLQKEFMKYIPASDEALKHSIRLVALPGGIGPDAFATIEDEFLAAYRQLHETKKLKCVEADVTYEDVVAPKVAILDFFGYKALLGLREINPRLKVYAWACTSVAGCIRMCGPEYIGGAGDRKELVEAEVARTGRPVLEVAEEFIRKANGSLIKVPGLPPMYDYEFMPQDVPFVAGASIMRINLTRCLVESDGVITQSFEAYEGESLQAMRDWMRKEKSLEVYSLVLPEFPDPCVESPEVKKMKTFLNTVEEKCGAQSLLYISFGTIFWTAQPEKIWTFVEALMDLNTPFVFAYASPFATVPEDISRKMDSYDLGLLTPWAPQHLILTHPATGWFVTHGGQNSTLESLSTGIPMIFWPFDADQPANAAHSCHDLNIAYELFQIRTGPQGIKPLHRLTVGSKAGLCGGPSAEIVGTKEAIVQEVTEMLEKARGEDGRIKRQNMKKYSDAVKKGWEAPDGEFVREVNRFLSDVQGH